MKYRPSYRLTSVILKLLQDISILIGEINILHLDKPPTQLRKKNQIKSIHSSLASEGNSLTINQVTSLINQKRVIGHAKDIREVQNAISIQ